MHLITDNSCCKGLCIGGGPRVCLPLVGSRTTFKERDGVVLKWFKRVRVEKNVERVNFRPSILGRGKLRGVPGSKGGEGVGGLEVTILALIETPSIYPCPCPPLLSIPPGPAKHYSLLVWPHCWLHGVWYWHTHTHTHTHTHKARTVLK